MLRSYLKIAFRNGRRHRFYSLINLGGLTVGLTCMLLIMLFVQQERSFDRFHRHADQTYRITSTMQMGDGEVPIVAPGPLGPALVQGLPGVTHAARVRCVAEPLLVQFGGEPFSEPGLCFAGPGLFEVFDFTLEAGHPETALAAPYGLVLSPTLAHKYFGARDPVGEALTLNGIHTYTVTGVLAPPAGNTHIQFELLASFGTLEILDPVVSTWAEGGANPYVVLAPDYSADALQAHLEAHLDDYMGYFSKGITAHLEPLTDIYLHSRWPAGLSERRGDIQYMYLFATIALIILLVAGINYVNLVTARALQRAREVGVRKSVGATLPQLRRQFLSESIFLSVLAFAMALVLAALLVSSFGDLLNRDLGSRDVFNPGLLLIGFGIAMVLGFGAGSYPAFYLSTFDPVVVLKGRTRAGRGRGRLQKLLVVTQFAVSIGLTAGTIVLWNQLDYMRQAKLGFDKEHIVLVTPNDAVRPQYAAFKQELKRTPGVRNVTTAPFPGWTHVSVTSSIPEGYQREPGEKLPGIPTYEVDRDFVETLGIDLIAGRDFDEQRPEDREGSILINEALAKELGWDSPLGKTITQPLGRVNPRRWVPSRVIGIVKDFHNATMKRAIDPLLIRLRPSDDIDRFGNIIVKVHGRDVSAILKQIESIWASFSPDRPFVYSFLDEEIDQFYQANLRLGRLLNVFTIIAAGIACLGLLGLAAFTAEQRTKEIGIRKILGASTPRLIALLSREYVALVGLAFAIAAPVAYVFMQRWLQQFAYAVEIRWNMLALLGAGALLLAMAAISYQAVRAALADPVKSLRYE